MAESKTQVLVVEDEPRVRRFLESTLVAHGYAVVAAATAREATIHAVSRNPDLLLIDLGLPDRDGLDLIHDLRAWCTAPILILSARGREQEKVAGLDAGADDYLAKPIGVEELLARVRALLRRQPRADGARGSRLACGDLELDVVEHRASRAGAKLELTPIEFKLLAVLLRHAGKLVTHDLLLKEVWGPKVDEDSQYLRVHVHHLRRKIEEDPSRPRRLLTELGVGYRLVAPS